MIDPTITPCRTCGAAPGQRCTSGTGGRGVVAHSLRKSDAAAIGRDPAEEVATLASRGRLRAFLLFAEAGLASRRADGQLAVCRGSLQALPASLFDDLQRIGAASTSGTRKGQGPGVGWQLTEFGQKMADVAGSIRDSISR